MIISGRLCTLSQFSQVSDYPITENSFFKESKYALKSSDLFIMLLIFRCTIKKSVFVES